MKIKGSVQNSVKTLIPQPLSASLAAWPKEKLLTTFFRWTGSKEQKWPKGLDLNMTPKTSKIFISILLAILDLYDQSVGKKS